MPSAAGASPVHVVQRVNEAQIRKLFIATRQLLERVLDVQVRDIVGENLQLVSVDLVPVLVLQPVGRQVVHQVSDERPRSRRGIENVHLLITQRLAEVLLEQPVCSADNEVHHLVWRVNYAEAVSGTRVVSLVEIFVDGFKKPLLLFALGDVVRSAANGSIVGPQAVNCLDAPRCP